MRELDVLAVDRAAHDDAIALVVSADHDAMAAVIVGDVLAVVSPLFSLGLALLARGLADFPGAEVADTGCG